MEAGGVASTIFEEEERQEVKRGEEEEGRRWSLILCYHVIRVDSPCITVKELQANI